ncbi:MAG: PEP-CTERM sorting domain-containing protein [Planctomycetia bacterium]|nr:PEP-CTERM sorting domain-containing protein [Planctomycetia bacterium]
MVSVGNGAVVTWTGGTDNSWATAANWSASAVPTAADDVEIGSSVTVSTPAEIAGQTLTLSGGGTLSFPRQNGYGIGSTTIGNGGTLSTSAWISGSITLQAGGTLSVSGSFRAGNGVAGQTIYVQTGGTATSSNWLTLGAGTTGGAANTVKIQGGLLKTTAVNDSAVFGLSGSTVVEISEDLPGVSTQMDFTSLGIGNRNGNHANNLSSVQMSGGTMLIRSTANMWSKGRYGLLIGMNDGSSGGKGEMLLSGGLVNVLAGTDGNVYVGYRTGTGGTVSGKLDISGGEMNVANGIVVAGGAADVVGSLTLREDGVLRVGEIDTTRSVGTATFSWTGGELTVGTYTGDFTNEGTTLAPADVSFDGVSLTKNVTLTDFGTTTVVGDYLQKSGRLLMDVQFAADGTISGQDLFLADAITLEGGDLEINVLGDVYEDGFQVSLFGSAPDFSGTFANILTNVEGYAWTLDYATGVATLQGAAGVPEPATWCLLLLGLGLLYRYRR